MKPTTFELAAEQAAHEIDEVYLLGATMAELEGAWDSLHPNLGIEEEFLNMARVALSYGLGEYDFVASAHSWVPTLVAKQRDYGPNNILRFGYQGLRVRTWDKIARLQNLEGDSDAENEPAVDSVMDIVGYCLIGIMLVRGTFELPLRSAA